MIISFFTTRVILQQLGAEDYGLNNLVGSVVSMFSFIQGSMATAVQRYYSIDIGRGNEERLGRIFGVGLYLHIIVAIITLILVEVFAVFFLNKLNIPINRQVAAQVVFQISAFSLILNILNVPYIALLRAREEFSKMAILDIAQSLLRLGVLYLLVHISYDKLITLSFLNLGITIVYVGSLTLIAYKYKETHNKPIRDKELIKQMLTFISMLIITVLASLLKTQGVVVLVNLFFGLIINAAYAVAVQVSNIVNSFALNFKQSMVPQMMSAYGAGDLVSMHKIINIGTKITFLLMLMISIPVIFDSQFILTVWLKNPPEHAAHLVTLVLISINISSFTYFHYQGVHASGNITAQQIWISSTYLINVFLIYFVFKKGAGFESAIYVNMIISIIQCGINLYYARKTYEYSSLYFAKKIVLPCLFSVVVIVTILSIITHNISISFFRFVVDFVVSEFLVCLLGYTIVLDKTERQQILRFVNGFLGKK